MAEAHLPPAQTAAICTTPRPEPPGRERADAAAARQRRVAERLPTSAGRRRLGRAEAARAVRRDEALVARGSDRDERRSPATRTVLHAAHGRLAGREDRGERGRRAAAAAAAGDAARVRPERRRARADADVRRDEDDRPRRRRARASTGLPDAPKNQTSIARSVSSASSPPTMKPFGHVELVLHLRPRHRAATTGTTTHGPATGTHAMKPRHSLVAAGGVRRARRATASASARDDEHALHGTLLNQSAESAPPASRSSAASRRRSRR